MEEAAVRWLFDSVPPPDFYCLLGLPRFTSDMTLVKTRLREATRTLFPYQNHKNKFVAARATQFLHLLGEAQGIVDDPAKLAAYDRDHLDELRQHFQANYQSPKGAPTRALAAEWLREVAKVDPDRVSEILSDWFPKGSE